MNNDIIDVLDTIDAAVFSGDTFHDAETLEHFRYLLVRWTKEADLITKLNEDRL